MNPFSACLLLPLVAFASGALGAPSAAHVEKWESFKSKHGKMHASSEDVVRMQRFIEVDAEIAAHNEKFARGEVSYSMQHSKYSDLSLEEFRSQALGLSTNVNVTEAPHTVSLSPLMPSAPAAFDWRSQGVVTPAKDQGYCGSCYAFAAAAVLESYLLRRNMAQGGIDLSEQDVVDCSYQRYNDPMAGLQNGGCKGGWPTSCFNYYNQKDLVLEGEYGYTSGRSQQIGQCRAPNALRNVVAGKLAVRRVTPRSEDELADIMVQKGPLVMALAADDKFKAMFQNLGSGIFDRDDTSNLQPNHAVALVGFGVENGKRFWLIKNSWGAQWGMSGFGKLVRGKNICNMMAHGFWFVE